MLRGSEVNPEVVGRHRGILSREGIRSDFQFSCPLNLQMFHEAPKAAVMQPSFIPL